MLFLPSAVSDMLKLLSSYSVKCVEIESVDYEADSMVKIIASMEPEFIMVPNALSETKEKMTIGIDALKVLLADNYRQNVDVITLVGGSFVHDCFVKQLSGKWLRFNRVISNEICISHTEFSTFRNQHELLKIVEHYGIDLHISPIKDVA